MVITNHIRAKSSVRRQLKPFALPNKSRRIATIASHVACEDHTEAIRPVPSRTVPSRDSDGTVSVTFATSRLRHMDVRRRVPTRFVESVRRV